MSQMIDNASSTGNFTSDTCQGLFCSEFNSSSDSTYEDTDSCPLPQKYSIDLQMIKRKQWKWIQWDT